MSSGRAYVNSVGNWLSWGCWLWCLHCLDPILKFNIRRLRFSCGWKCYSVEWMKFVGVYGPRECWTLDDEPLNIEVIYLEHWLKRDAISSQTKMFAFTSRKLKCSRWRALNQLSWKFFISFTHTLVRTVVQFERGAKINGHKSFFRSILGKPNYGAVWHFDSRNSRCFYFMLHLNSFKPQYIVFCETWLAEYESCFSFEFRSLWKRFAFIHHFHLAIDAATLRHQAYSIRGKQRMRHVFWK